MNKRKLKRAKSIPARKVVQSSDRVITEKAEQMVRCAITRKPKIDCIGNFIFFATDSGDAWLIDHRDNRALRLAHGFKALPYKIIESKERFKILWTGRYQIIDESFSVKTKEGVSVYKNYPTKTIQSLIDMLQERE